MDRASIKWRKGSINRPPQSGGCPVKGPDGRLLINPTGSQVRGKWSELLLPQTRPYLAERHFQSWLETCQPADISAWKIYKGKLPSSGRWEEENVELYSLQSDEKKRGIKAAACNDLLNSSAHTFIRARIWDDRIAGLRIWHPTYSALLPRHPLSSYPSNLKV